MVKFSKTTEYALLALQYIINKQESASTAKEIADACDLPYELLAKILQKLGKGNILTSIKGVKGGYQFNNSPDEISLKSIIDSLGESAKLTKCLHNNPSNSLLCARENCCKIKDPITNIQLHLDNMLEQISIRQIL